MVGWRKPAADVGSILGSFSWNNPGRYSRFFYLSFPNMTRSAKKTPSFFIVPDEKIDYAEFVQLGNVLYSLTEPDNVLSQPRLTGGPHPLGSKVRISKPLEEYTITSSGEEGSKIGFFAKVAELFGLGVNASLTKAAANSESYTITSMAISTFAPTTEFLDAVKIDPDVNDILRNSQERCAFLITGVAVATGVQFTSSQTKENEKEGSMGISSHAFSLGPRGSKRRKNVLEVSYVDDGPVTLAFKVQKLQLRPDGSMGADDYIEGAYFGDDERKYVVDEDADLTNDDVGELQGMIVVDEVSGEEYVLYVQ